MNSSSISENFSRSSNGSAAISIATWKRAIDLTLSIIAIAAISPIILAIALYIKVVSPGPIFYRQSRVGKHGKIFNCLKFRTMKVNSSTSSHEKYCQELIHSNAPMTKLDNKNDPRLIPMAWIIRSTGLDELPQLANVLRGEMSLVGPRPCTPFELEQYLPWQRERLNGMPGITGLWQVTGKNRTTFDEMIRLDIDYVREHTVKRDIQIILQTIPAIVGQLLETRKQRKNCDAQ